MRDWRKIKQPPCRKEGCHARQPRGKNNKLAFVSNTAHTGSRIRRPFFSLMDLATARFTS